MNYNERRKQPDRCSGCGKRIELGRVPKVCDNCLKRKENYTYPRAETDDKPVLRKLKTYKVPTEPWRLFLYEQVRNLGIKGLAAQMGMSQSTLLKYVYTKRKPITRNLKILSLYFRQNFRDDLAMDLHKKI